MDEEAHGGVIPSTSPAPADAGGAGPSNASSQSHHAGIHQQDLEEAGVSAEEELQVDQENQGQPSNHQSHRHHHQHGRRHQHLPTPAGVSYRFNVAISDFAPGYMRDDVWSCLLVLVTFWFFASMTLILGFFGSDELQLGPNCSTLISTNPIFVRSIKGQLEEQVSGPMLYGFHRIPPLDAETSWSETHSQSLLTNYHKEWVYQLNAGSYIDISYDVKSMLYLVIAQGAESLVEWVEDPLYPNTTLSWNIIDGRGKIGQEITSSATYYVAIGNLNSETAEVELNFTIKSIIYNTTRASFKCSLSHACSFDLSLLKENVVVLTSPGPEEAKDTDDWYVEISYGPRWATYFVGSGIMIIVILAAFRFCNMFQASHGDSAGYRTVETGQGSREPLLSPKDDDLSSLGSSYDSLSQDEEDLEESIQERKPEKGDQANINPRRLCVICYDAPRDCFFLPCGHCAACFTCGSKIAEEAGTCPICRRKMKKVRKIFTV